VDCEDCGCAGGICHGLLEYVGEIGESLDMSTESPALNGAVAGVRDLDGGPERSARSERSPSRTKVSTDLSRLPFKPLSMVMFRFSSVNPMSRSLASFTIISSSDDCSEATVVPNLLDGLFFLGGVGPSSSSLL
jgi:hypothetical protein